MSTWRDVYGIFVKIPQLEDLLDVATVDIWVRSKGIRSVPLLSQCPTPGAYMERLGLGVGQDLDATLGREFVDALPLGWQYGADIDMLKTWDKERTELRQWTHYQVPAEKASVKERREVATAALDKAREERQNAILTLVAEMETGTDPIKWLPWVAEKIRPFDMTVIAMRGVVDALDSLAEPNNQERDEALAAVRLAKTRLEIVERKISMYWAERFLKFENGIREQLGLSPVKKNANKKKTPQEVSAT